MVATETSCDHVRVEGDESITKGIEKIKQIIHACLIRMPTHPNVCLGNHEVDPMSTKRFRGPGLPQFPVPPAMSVR